MTVIDGVTNGAITTIPVGRSPCDFCHNPAQNRVYTANYDGFSISVLRDSMPGIEEGFGLQALSSRPVPTVVRSVLLFEQADCEGRTATGELLDVSGRKALDLGPGANDVRALAPGVYFVRQASGMMREASGVIKVVVTR